LKPPPFFYPGATSGPPFSFEIDAMRKDQVVDALAKCGKQFILPNFHSAQDGAIAARDADLVVNSYVDSEATRPICILFNSEREKRIIKRP
jgi:hypothetical protein